LRDITELEQYNPQSWKKTFYQTTHLVRSILAPLSITARRGDRTFKMIAEYTNGFNLTVNLSDLAFGSLKSLKHALNLSISAQSLALGFLGFQAFTETKNAIIKLYNTWNGLTTQYYNAKDSSVSNRKQFWWQFAKATLKISTPIALIDSALLGIVISGGVASFPAAPFLFTAGLLGLGVLNTWNFCKKIRDHIKHPIKRTPQDHLALASKGLKSLCFIGLAVSIPIFFFVPAAQPIAGGLLLGFAGTLFASQFIKHCVQRWMEQAAAYRVAKYQVNYESEKQPEDPLQMAYNELQNRALLPQDDNAEAILNNIWNICETLREILDNNDENNDGYKDIKRYYENIYKIYNHISENDALWQSRNDIVQRVRNNLDESKINQFEEWINQLQYIEKYVKSNLQEYVSKIRTSLNLINQDHETQHTNQYQNEQGKNNDDNDLESDHEGQTINLNNNNTEQQQPLLNTEQSSSEEQRPTLDYVEQYEKIRYLFFTYLGRPQAPQSNPYVTQQTVLNCS